MLFTRAEKVRVYAHNDKLYHFDRTPLYAYSLQCTSIGKFITCREIPPDPNHLF